MRRSREVRIKAPTKHIKKNAEAQLVEATGSGPDEITGLFHWLNPSGRTMALGSTQLLTEISTRDIPLRAKAAGA